jgi:hypothetical protein
MWKNMMRGAPQHVAGDERAAANTTEGIQKMR